MSFYAQPDSHIRNKIKVELDLPNYSTKKELTHATGVDTSDLKRLYCFESWSW